MKVVVKNEIDYLTIETCVNAAVCRDTKAYLTEKLCDMLLWVLQGAEDLRPETISRALYDALMQQGIYAELWAKIRRSCNQVMNKLYRVPVKADSRKLRKLMKRVMLAQLDVAIAGVLAELDAE